MIAAREAFFLIGAKLQPTDFFACEKELCLAHGLPLLAKSVRNCK
jgi:hypothetical protein